ncbi:hypothetical protein PX699_06540 [Sphingobium sp. H39-3-25]|uniref:hypothetical protein n=1 Tax=Sphingobium arseniciresistens TaxID=3030834 RepID=UPI0023B9D7C3|nr:hypothetical protein [Sphingobium arseniciresistens]
MEDLNYLLHREQEELLRAQLSSCQSARMAHAGLASGYAQRIGAHRLPYRTPRQNGAIAFDPAPFGANAVFSKSAAA